MNNSNKMLWFVAGASVGATLALLFAPQSGDETRRYLGEQSRDLLDKGRSLAEEAADRMEEGIGRARRKFQS